MKKLILLGVTISFTMASIAQETENITEGETERFKTENSGFLPIDLATALKLARAQNSDIALARETVKQATAQLKQKKYLLIPDLSFGASIHHTDGPLQETGGSILDVSRSSSHFGAGSGAVGAGSPTVPGLSLTVNLADAYFEPLAARQNQAAVIAAGDAVHNNLLLEVAQAYLGLVGPQAHVAVAEENVQNASELAQYTRDFAASGEGLHSDAQRAEVQRLISTGNLEATRGNLVAAGAELARLLHLEASVELQPVDKDVASILLINPVRSLHELVATALKSRPEIKQSLALVNRAEQRIKQSKYSPFVPNIALSASAGGFGGGTGSNFGDPDGRTDLNALVYWRFKNFGLGEKERIKERRSILAQSKHSREGLIDQIIAEVKLAHSQVNSHQKQIAIAEAAVKSAQSSFVLNRSRIFERQGLPIEMLQALQSLASARQYYVNTVTAFNQAQYRLYTSIGQAPPNPN
ncbi:MAG TPA: TolC family protein [Verrucomicrobia bacterium]|nr:TolC family protein [Verrucomicrobiota bacterium]